MLKCSFMSTGLTEWEVGLGKFSSTFQLRSPINPYIYEEADLFIVPALSLLSIPAQHSQKYLIQSSLQSDNQIIIIAIIIPILQMCKPKLKELNNLENYKLYKIILPENYRIWTCIQDFLASISAHQLPSSNFCEVEYSSYKYQQDDCKRTPGFELACLPTWIDSGQGINRIYI